MGTTALRNMASFNFNLADGSSMPGVGLGVFMMQGADCVRAVSAALVADTVTSTPHRASTTRPRSPRASGRRASRARA